MRLAYELHVSFDPKRGVIFLGQNEEFDSVILISWTQVPDLVRHLEKVCAEIDIRKFAHPEQFNAPDTHQTS